MESVAGTNNKYILGIAVVLIIVPYYLMIFTFWGNPYHGPGPWSSAAMDGFLTVGAYSAFILFRSAKSYRARGVVSLVGLPLFAAVGFRLYWAVSNYYVPWITT